MPNCFCGIPLAISIKGVKSITYIPTIANGVTGNTGFIGKSKSVGESLQYGKVKSNLLVFPLKSDHSFIHNVYTHVNV